MAHHSWYSDSFQTVRNLFNNSDDRLRKASISAPWYVDGDEVGKCISCLRAALFTEPIVI